MLSLLRTNLNGSKRLLVCAFVIFVVGWLGFLGFFGERLRLVERKWGDHDILAVGQRHEGGQPQQWAEHCYGEIFSI